MDSIYKLTEWDKARMAILKQERDRLWKQIGVIENEIHHIFEKSLVKIRLRPDDDECAVLEKLRAAGVISDVDDDVTTK